MPRYNNQDITLHKSLSLPSITNNYSIAVEYIQGWFFKKFDNDFFKTVHLNDKHILDDFRGYSNSIKNLKTQKPSLSITPVIDLEHDREGLDRYLYSQANYIRKGIFSSCFFKDHTNKIFIDIRMEEMKVDFNFKIRVSTRAQQLDLYKYLVMAFRIGATQHEYLDMDFHVSNDIMIQLAKDAGFVITGGKIENTIDFLNYLNKNSLIPFTYKYRTLNGNSEYFLRIKDCYTHISCLDNLSSDEGEREGMLMNNFTIDMRCTLKIPAPKFYTYYSYEPHNISAIQINDKNKFGLFSINLPVVKHENDKGWKNYICTECYEDDLSKPLSIEFGELIENSDLHRAIKYHNEVLLSPEIFIDVRLINANYEPCKIDWHTLTISTDKQLVEKTSRIVFYVDLSYLSDCIIQINELYKDRYDKSNTGINGMD